MSTRVRVAAGLSCLLVLGVVLAWGEEPPVPRSKQEGRGRWLNFGRPELQADLRVFAETLQRNLSLRKDDTPWWSPLGPGFIVDGQIGVSGRAREVAGRVISIAVHPEKSRHVWLVGTAGGGIWRTKDGGKTWAPAKMPCAPSSAAKEPCAPSSPAVGAIAFGSGDTVYAGTGDTSEQGLSGSGLLVSVNSGQEWRRFDVDLHNGYDPQPGRGSGEAWLLTAVTGIVVRRNDANCKDLVSGDSIWVAVSRARGDTIKPEEDTTKLGLFYLADQEGCRKPDVRPVFKPVFPQAPRPVSDLRRCPPSSQAPVPPPVDCVFVARPSTPDEDPFLLHRVWLTRDGRLECVSLAPSQYPNTVAQHLKLAPFEGEGRTLYLGFLESTNVALLRTDNAWGNGQPWKEISFHKAATASNPAAYAFLGYCNWDPASGTPQKSVCHHANVLSVSREDPDVVFAGGVALWECRDCRHKGKQEWRDISYLTPPGRPDNFISPSNGIHVDQQAMAWAGDKQRGYRLVVANDGGVWSAPDPSRVKWTDRVQWANHSLGLEITQIYRGALDRRRPSVVFAGTQDTGTIRRHSGWPGRWLERWRWIQGGDGVGVVVSHKDPALHWATLHQSVLIDEVDGRRTRLAMWRTRDAGLSFQRADLGLERQTNQWVPPFVQCPNPEGDVLLYGDRSLWRVDQLFRIPTLRAFEGSSPPTWQRNYRPAGGSDEITAIAFAPDTPSGKPCQAYAFADTTGTIRITHSGGGVVRPSVGTDQTTPWCYEGKETPWCRIGQTNQWSGRTVSALAFETPTVNTPTVLYAAIADYNKAESVGHVFRIEQEANGTGWKSDWQDVTPLGLDVPFKSLAIVPAKGARTEPTVFAGTTLGVWMSSNVWTSPKWSRNPHDPWCRLALDANTSDVSVEDLRVHPKTGWVYAFTFGRGVFRLEDVDEAVSDCRERLNGKGSAVR